MIIGISGKIESGKDTVAEIIQYLLFRNNKHEVGLDNSFEEFRKIINKEWSKEEITIETSFEIKKFADKVKDIVCMFIGCTREQLEDREFKEKELGEEWIRYGYADGFTIDEKEQKVMKFKECDKERYELELKINWQTAYKIHYTPRLLLQHIGTDLMKNQLLDNIWVNALMAGYRGKSLGIDKYGVQTIKYPNWIITDLRFPNELEAIKQRNGITIRVNRKISKEEDVNQSLLGAMSNYKEHPSETALDNYQDFDYIIENDGTIEDLVEKVKRVLQAEYPYEHY